MAHEQMSIKRGIFVKFIVLTAAIVFAAGTAGAQDSDPDPLESFSKVENADYLKLGKFEMSIVKASLSSKKEIKAILKTVNITSGDMLNMTGCSGTDKKDFTSAIKNLVDGGDYSSLMSMYGEQGDSSTGIATESMDILFKVKGGYAKEMIFISYESSKLMAVRFHCNGRMDDILKLIPYPEK